MYIAVTMKRKSVQYLKWFFPVLFIAYLGMVISFTHVHIENGVTIVHSHPFKKQADGSSHKHSTAEFQLLHQLSILVAEDAALCTQLAVWLIGSTLLLCQTARVFVPRPAKGNSLLRAPPVAA